jgi:hypothetical protein
MLRSCDSFSVLRSCVAATVLRSCGGSDKGRVAVDAVHPAEHPSQGSRLHLQELFLLQLGQQLVHPERKGMSVPIVVVVKVGGGGGAGQKLEEMKSFSSNP